MSFPEGVPIILNPICPVGVVLVIDGEIHARSVYDIMYRLRIEQRRRDAYEAFRQLPPEPSE